MSPVSSTAMRSSPSSVPRTRSTKSAHGPSTRTLLSTRACCSASIPMLRPSAGRSCVRLCIHLTVYTILTYVHHSQAGAHQGEEGRQQEGEGHRYRPGLLEDSLCSLGGFHSLALGCCRSTEVVACQYYATCCRMVVICYRFPLHVRYDLHAEHILHLSDCECLRESCSVRRESHPQVPMLCER